MALRGVVLINGWRFVADVGIFPGEGVKLAYQKVMTGRADSVGFMIGFATFALMLIVMMPARASDDLRGAINAHALTDIFPGADHVGDVEGDPSAAPVFRNHRLVGYLYLTSDVVKSAGFSGKPVKILAGLNLAGKITGAVVYKHEEPILILGIAESKLDDFIDQFSNVDVRQRVRVGASAGKGETEVDMVSGASITSHVFADSIMRAGRLIARSRGIIGTTRSDHGELELEKFESANWQRLLEIGAIRELRLSRGQVASALSRDNKVEGADKLFIDLYAGLATPAGIGQNLLGFSHYNQMISALEPGTHPVFVASNGFYSFRGYAYRQSGVFERLQLVQGENTIRLKKEMHRSAVKLTTSDAPKLREISLFYIPATTGFDPLQPWRLELLVEDVSETEGKRYAGFSLSYNLPDQFVRQPPDRRTGLDVRDPDMPLWQVRWADMQVEVIVLSVALEGLLVLLVFQDWLVHYRKQVDLFRLGFLAFTLIFIGWITAAQLSVINILTFVSALLTEFRWDFFLLEPLIFLLWGFVALALLFWGRGVFCGWLCPFGALQELLNRIATRLKIPQYALPFAVNERLWAIKYVVFLGLFALSLGSLGLAGQVIEVEPFKTVIALKFIRAWPFVVYAVILLIAGLFVNRFFCRYLCPLGAALAIPANNRMFDWLKRRHQCGTQCDVCALSCPVQAIHPNGHIDVHECIYCLNCQRNYHDDHLCPPLVDLRKRRERRHAMGEGRKRAD